MSKDDSICILLGDSRINNFDNYPQPSDLNIRYYIERGAKINDLKKDAVSTLESVAHKFNSNEVKTVCIKTAAGINNLTKFTTINGQRILSCSLESADQVFQELKDLRKHILNFIPSALISFVTVPSVDLLTFNEHHCKEFLVKEQISLETKVDQLNTLIKAFNCRATAQTVSFHNSVQKRSIKKDKRGRRRIKFSYVYKVLYDGLHASSEIKHKWFEEIIKPFRKEVSYVSKDKALYEKKST